MVHRKQGKKRIERKKKVQGNNDKKDRREQRNTNEKEGKYCESDYMEEKEAGKDREKVKEN